MSYQIATEMFAQAAGISLLHVPYKRSAPAIQAVAAGEVALAIADVDSVNPMVKAGRLRALGVSTSGPSRTMPGVPPIASEGVSGYEASVWAGLFAPAKTDGAVIDRLQQALGRLQSRPDYQDSLVALGLEPASSSGAALGTLIASEIERYAGIAKRRHPTAVIVIST